MKTLADKVLEFFTSVPDTIADQVVAHAFDTKTFVDRAGEDLRKKAKRLAKHVYKMAGGRVEYEFEDGSVFIDHNGKYWEIQ